MKNLAKLLSVLLIIFPVYTNVAIADESEEELKNFVLQLTDKTFKILNQNKSNPSGAKGPIRTLLNDNLNLAWMAKHSLGRFRKNVSKDQLATFTEAYSKYVVNSYLSLVSHYNDQEVKLRSVRALDDKKFIVSMNIIEKENNQNTKVDYLVHRFKGKNGTYYKVSDIITEGISTLNSQQSEFKAILNEKGIDGLISNLGQKS